MNRANRSTTRWVDSVLIVALLAGLRAFAFGAGFAMVTDLQGKATVTTDGRPRPVTILSDLESGAQVQLEAGATLVVLYLEAGEEFVFKGPAHIAFTPGQPEVVTGAKAERRSLALGKSGKDIRIKPVGMALGAIVMRAGPSSTRIRLLNLHGTRTLDAQPEFRWQQLQPGLEYQFTIADDTGHTVHEAHLDATSLRLPSGVTLKEGVPYRWEVSASLPDSRKCSGSGDFSVASSDLRVQADALRPAASASLSTRIAFAAWLEQMELRDEAQTYWKAAAAERPDDTRLQALAAR